MKSALGALGYPVGRNKVKKLMQEAGVQARYRKNINVLNRLFVVKGPYQAYVGDITY